MRFITALTQRRQRHFQAVEPVIQILAKTAVLDSLQKIAVSRTDDPHVDSFRLAADRHHLPVLKHAQETGLQGQRHVADFIKEQCAAIGLLKFAAHAVLARAGKTASAIAEQLTFDQAFRNRRAIEGNEGFARALTGLMHGLGESLFAGARFTIDQQRHITLENPQGFAKVRLQRRITETNPRQARSLRHDRRGHDRRRFARLAA
ncbi:hypothetical protein SRM1_05063 [Pseudomonas fluorescens]|nr:hypothetical protein SRM1_05063 [Pseudomonas fluorescens]